MIEKIVNFLKAHPGYLKWGNERLATLLATDILSIALARQFIVQINEPQTSPKILFLDIETSPLQAYTWGMWNQNLNLDSITSDWFIISWAAKWANTEYSFGDVLTPEEALEEDDSRIVKELWEILEEADIVVTHNGDKFDIKKINARFIENGLGPVSPFQSIDTLKVARKNFSFTSNKLEALARKFNIEGKHKTDFNLWKECLRGNPKALDTMLLYNNQDVLVLEKIYYILRPWMSSHPNLGLYNITEEMKCPNCGSVHLEDIGYATTSISKFESYRCSDCGAISKGRSTILTREENKFIITPGK